MLNVAAVPREIRVAHIVDQLAGAGAQKALLTNLERLDRRFRSHVYSIYPDDTIGPRIRALGIPTTCLGARSALDLPAATLKLWRELRRRRFDIVHTQVFPADVSGRVAGRLAAVPVVITTFQSPVAESLSTGDGARLKRAINRLTYRIGRTHAIAVSDAVRASVAEEFGDTSATVIPNSAVVDLAEWEPATPDDRRTQRANLGLAEGEIVFVCVARFGVEKGHEVLLRAIAELGSLSSLTLLLLGDGPERPMLEQLTTTLGIADQVRFLGWVEDPRPAMAAADILVMPSLTEGFPIALLEGMAAGLPAVASSVGGVPEIAVDGETALLVPARMHERLAAAMRTLALDRSLRERLAKHARARAVEICGSVDPVERLAALYDALLKERTRAGTRR